MACSLNSCPAWLATAAWLLLTSLAEGKLQSGTVGIGGPGGEQNRWRYLSKFGYGLGYGRYDVRLKLHEPRSIEFDAQLLSLDLYLDESWDHAEVLPACSRVGEGKSQTAFDVEISKSGEWTEWHSGYVEHRVRSHIWYFALSNCRNPMNTDATVFVDFEFRARQEDGSEFSVEVLYMLTVHIAALLIFTVFLIGYVAWCSNIKRINDGMHPVIWVLSGALATQYVAQALHTAHLWRYRSDGTGELTLDMLSESLFMASQVIHTTLLCVIANGYTLLESKASNAGAMKWMALAALLVHIALVCFGKLEDDASHKHHQNEGTVGWIILAIRLILLAQFMYAVRRSQHEAGFKLSDFLQRFQLAGATYFLAYPAIFLVVQVLAPYLRHPAMQVGVLVMQLTSDFWLAGLFLSRGAYFRLSTLSDSFLPGTELSPIRHRDAVPSPSPVRRHFCTAGHTGTKCNMPRQRFGAHATEVPA